MEAISRIEAAAAFLLFEVGMARSLVARLPFATALTRRWPSLNAMCAAAALLYAVAVAVAATGTADTGFFTLFGGPILAVEGGSGAEAAGLAAGDVLLAVDGVPTPTAHARDAALARLSPGAVTQLEVGRQGQRLAFTVLTSRRLPLGSVAGALAALGLLLVSAYAGHRQVFQRVDIIYVVFIAGVLVFHSAVRIPVLAVPLFFCMTLAAPATYHLMVLFPAGDPLSRRGLWLVYGPPVLVGGLQAVNAVLFSLGAIGEEAIPIGNIGLKATSILAAFYLTVGGVVRWRRMRRKRDELDPIAARWLTIGAVTMAAPLIAVVVWQTVSPESCLGGGFQPLVATSMAGGSICIFLALSRERFVDVGRLVRRGAGHVISAGVAAAVLLVAAAIFGSRVAGSNVVLFGTFLAGVLLAPLGARLQRSIDERFSAEHARTRRLLGQAVEHAARSLDLVEIEQEVTRRCAEALRADGCALYLADDGGFRRVAIAGSVELPERFDDPRLQLSVAVRNLDARLVAVRIPGERPAKLIVAPSEQRPIEDDDRELLATTAAGLAVALANASAHTSLRRMSERLRTEVDQSERRRREIARLKERLEEDKHAVEAELARVGGVAPVIGEGLRPTFDLVHRVARSEATVLVTGETGVGKELVARALHAGSARREGPFVVVDCGAIAAGVFESMLFGHERGAFTGAIRAAQGSFRAAQAGTLFLDEIGELPLELQPKLLRVLQEKEVIPVGAARPIAVDARVVAGTNRDLEAEVRAGHFREDLLYRLRVIDIVVPPLRARKADIPELAAGFLRAVAEHRQQRPRTLAPDAIEALLAHDWPGNVRELQHVVEAAALTSEGDELHIGDLGIADDIFRRRAEDAVARAGDDGPGLRETLSTLERDRLVEVLREHDGNRTAAAKALGLSRTSLRRRLARYGIA
jgi:two-component system, NtrC family, response regulator HydG